MTENNGVTGFDKLEVAGQAVIKAALEFWNQNIIDPLVTDVSDKGKACAKFIDEIIRTDKGLNWSWEIPYLGDGYFAWCGAFAAACWAKAGMKLDIREKSFASTYRLDRYGLNFARKYCHCNTAGDVLAFGPREGDILLVGDNDWGHHITLVDGYDATNKELHTISGNGYGVLGNNKNGQGVVKHVYKLEKARRLIRPCLEDLSL